MVLGKIFKIDKSNQKQQITYKEISIRLSADFSAETLQAIKEWHDVFKVMKGKTYNHEYSTQQGCHSDSMDKSKALRTAKAKRIQHQQANFTTNTEGTSLGRKKTSNLKQLCVYTDCYIKTSWEWQTKKLQYTHTMPKVVIQITSEQRKTGRKKTHKNKSKTIKKMSVGTCVSIIILNVNGLNVPTKIYRLAE